MLSWHTYICMRVCIRVAKSWKISSKFWKLSRNFENFPGFLGIFLGFLESFWKFTGNFPPLCNPRVYVFSYRGCSHRRCFSIPVSYFSVVFLCKLARRTCMNIALMSRIFCSLSHMSAAFLRFCVELKEFTLLHAVTSPKTPEAGQAL